MTLKIGPQPHVAPTQRAVTPASVKPRRVLSTGTKTVTSYSKSMAFTPAQVLTPATTAEVEAAVREVSRRGGTVRVIGAGHAGSAYAATQDTLVDLSKLDSVQLDRATGNVTVGAGARLKDVVASLQREGRAFANLGSITEQAAAGAIITGTHGSGGQVLAMQVTALELTDARGKTHQLSREHDPAAFKAALVSVGAMGIITRLTFATVPAFNLEETKHVRPLEEVLSPSALADVDRHHSVMYGWMPGSDDVVVTQRDVTQKAPTFEAPPGPPKAGLLEVGVLRTVLGVGRAITPLVPVMNKFMAAAINREGHRIGRSDAVLTVPLKLLPPPYVEVEWSIPKERLEPVMTKLRALLEGGGAQVNFPVYVRFTKADDLPLSPSQGRDSAWIEVARYGEGKEVEETMKRVAELLDAEGARPHWGKPHTAAEGDLERWYPQTGKDFKQQVERFDPAGTFRSPALRRLLPGVSPEAQPLNVVS